VATSSHLVKLQKSKKLSEIFLKFVKIFLELSQTFIKKLSDIFQNFVRFFSQYITVCHVVNVSEKFKLEYLRGVRGEGEIVDPMPETSALLTGQNQKANKYSKCKMQCSSTDASH
jgi:hypothetical protein